MKVDAKPQNLLEYLVLKAGIVPLPLAHTQLMFIYSRAVLCAFKFELFEILKSEALTLEELASKSGLDKRALKSLMNVLIAGGYFSYSAEKYGLTKMARKWCLKDSPNSTYNQQMFNFVCWDWMTYMDEFLKTGKGLQYHESFNEKEWELYQKGMESVASSTARPAVKMAPAMQNPSQMLDIGGSHGIYSVEFCKKYPSLKSTILELQGAVKSAIEILSKYGMGERVKHKSGNVLKDDIGEGQYDLIFVSSLIHHFSKKECELLSAKVAKALKPGGYFIVQEFLRPETASKMEGLGSILDLFFNLSSTTGNWSLNEIKGFQSANGLQYFKLNKFLSPPGYVQSVSVKK